MEKNSRASRYAVGAFAAAAAAALVLGSAAAASAATPEPSSTTSLAQAQAQAIVSNGNSGKKPVGIEVFAPERHSNAGIEGKGWFVDMEIDFPGGPGGLAQSGFSGFQLTGPAGHNNVAPFPGSFSTGHDDRNPGLVVLTSTTNSTTPGFSGPGTNLANLFNLTGVTNRSQHETELWDTWIVGAPIAGQDVDTKLTVAVVADLNHDGIFNDAPDVVTDVNADGVIDAKDLKAIGVASNIVTVPFHINGAPA
jgi:opacity protein-like surface antigen